MPTYEVTDSDSGKTLRLTGDSPPTEAELEELFKPFNKPNIFGAARAFGRKSGLREAGETVGRAVGLAARDAVEGTAGLAGIVTNPIVAGVNAASNALGGPDLGSSNLGGAVSDTLDRAGLPAPETDSERVVSRINQAVAGGGGSIAAARAVAKGAPSVASQVGRKLAAAPSVQGVSAATGAGAGEVARDAGGGPLAVGAATLAGALAPGATTAGLAGATRAATRGGEAGRQNLQNTIDDFARAGDTPSLAQGTQGRVAQSIETGLSRVPGGAGVMAKSAQKSADDIGKRVEEIADSLVPKSTATSAGKAVTSGVKDFVSKFRERAGTLYDDVDQHIGVDDPVAIGRTLKFVKSQVAKTSKSEQVFTSTMLERLGVALDDDLATSIDSGSLNYAAVKALRSRVGEKLTNFTLIDDASKGQLKQLYGALSQDIKTALADNPAGLSASKRADAFYRAGRKRIDDLERVVKKNGGPEKVFQAAMSGTREGATTLRTVMKSVRPDDRKALAAAVIRRMGVATPGKQSGGIDAFSIETYLTNFAKLSKEARSTLFGRFGPDFQKNVDSLAKVAGNIREGSQVFANPSGTAQASTLNATAGAFALSVLTGQIEVAAGIGGVAGLNNLSARLMTNPNFVRWAAKSTTVSPGTLPAQINALAQVAKKEGDRDLAILAAILQEQAQSEPNQ